MANNRLALQCRACNESMHVARLPAGGDWTGPREEQFRERWLEDKDAAFAEFSTSMPRDATPLPLGERIAAFHKRAPLLRGPERRRSVRARMGERRAVVKRSDWIGAALEVGIAIWAFVDAADGVPGWGWALMAGIATLCCAVYHYVSHRQRKQVEDLLALVERSTQALQRSNDVLERRFPEVARKLAS